MIGGWMVYAIVVASVMALAATAVERGARLYRLPVRHVWLFAIAASAALPVLMRWWPTAPVPNHATRLVTLDAWTVPGQVVSGVGTRTASLDQWLAAGWLVASLLVLVWVGWTWWRLRAERTKWRHGAIDGVRVLVSHAVGPAVVGVWRPAVVVPEWLLALPAEERRVALLHEREHVAAGDTRMLLAGLAAVIAMPWNPALWWLFARLRAAVEVDCDQRVLATGVAAGRYANLLLRARQRGGALLALTPALLEPRSLLSRRVMEMLPPSIRARPWRAAGYLAGAAAMVLLACDTPGPQQLTEREQQPTGQRSGSIQFADIVSETAVDETPQRISCPAAEYPAMLQKARVEGAVGVKFVVDTAGKVVDGSVKVVGSSHKMFEKPATEMVSRCVFRPGRLNGQTVATTVEMPINFKLASPTRVLSSAETTMVLVRRADSVPAAATTPLYVVDGVIVAAKGLSLDPLKIEKIEVIKGAAARVLYGERARNGVISITTRK